MAGVTYIILLGILKFSCDIFHGVTSGRLVIAAIIYGCWIHGQMFETVLFVTIIIIWYAIHVYLRSGQVVPLPERVVFITGCDAAFGFSLALHLSDMAFTVVAACKKVNSEHAKVLKEHNQRTIMVIELDITNDVSIRKAIALVSKYVDTRQYMLWAVINTAGMMVLSEFEWQTNAMIKEQIDVNLEGTLKLTKAFCPLMRLHKTRLVTIMCDTTFKYMPGFPVYCATKTALQAWNDGLRMELGKYGVKVIAFVPGDILSSAEIMAKQAHYLTEIKATFTNEQNRFYGEYFKEYELFQRSIPKPTRPAKIMSIQLAEKFEDALLDIEPKSIYVYGSWSYRLSRMFYIYGPTWLVDFYIGNFLQLPGFSPPPEI